MIKHLLLLPKPKSTIPPHLHPTRIGMSAVILAVLRLQYAFALQQSHYDLQLLSKSDTQRHNGFKASKCQQITPKQFFP